MSICLLRSCYDPFQVRCLCGINVCTCACELKQLQSKIIDVKHSKQTSGLVFAWQSCASFNNNEISICSIYKALHESDARSRRNCWKSQNTFSTNVLFAKSRNSGNEMFWSSDFEVLFREKGARCIFCLRTMVIPMLHTNTSSSTSTCKQFNQLQSSLRYNDCQIQVFCNCCSFSLSFVRCIREWLLFNLFSPIVVIFGH